MSEETTRRNFMTRAIFAIFGFIAAAMATALGGFGIIPVLKKRTPGWSDAGTIGEVPADQPHERRFFEIVKSGWESRKQERSVWIVRKSDGNVVAFSASCPHLGCGFRWLEERKRFECPCHGSIFDLDGKVLAGPAPRPLDTMETKVENGRLLVRYELFKLGTAKKVAA